ncbi:MAG: hypothetical protein VX444_07385 [Pseudomonadota bacterium]|nr:hypothetical protein [Pseudomonadota bacterium]
MTQNSNVDLDELSIMVREALGGLEMLKRRVEAIQAEIGNAADRSSSIEGMATDLEMRLNDLEADVWNLQRSKK